jgi:tetratricopeptide (TPR) repeat protein
MTGVGGSTIQQHEKSLAGRRVLIAGKLASMPRREAEQLIREHGGELVDRVGETADLIVIPDDADPKRATVDGPLFDENSRQRIASGQIELLRESEFWARLGLVDSGRGVERLYTAAMLAELVHVPVAVIRQWHRRGVLRAHHEVRRLAYFDFEEVRVARKLVELIHAGCSLANVNRKLQTLSRLLADVPRPLADPEVVVEGRRLYVRRGESLAEPSGQLLIDFDAAKTQGEVDAGPVAIPFVARDALRHAQPDSIRGTHPRPAADLRALAAELEANGQEQQAADVYRAILFTPESLPDDHFALAELLYLAGDLAAARERYYMAIERDEDFVEARCSLGCVLAEQGDTTLAEAAFRGALEYHADYADAHYHLARLLDSDKRSPDASRHWQMFMNLAPASPWADEARERIAAGGTRLSTIRARHEENDLHDARSDH